MDSALYEQISHFEGGNGMRLQPRKIAEPADRLIVDVGGGLFLTFRLLAQIPRHRPELLQRARISRSSTRSRAPGRGTFYGQSGTDSHIARQVLIAAVGMLDLWHSAVTSSSPLRRRSRSDDR